MTGQVLPVRIDAAHALRRFRRRRFVNLFGFWPHPPAKVDAAGNPASLEIVWMPAYAYRFAMFHKGKQVYSLVSVDASFGGFSLFGRRGELEDAPADAEGLPPTIGEARAEELAREGIVRYILRTRGAKPNPEDIVERFTYHAPVWVYYFRRLGGKLDLAVLDAYSGDAMGGLVRRSIVEAFIAQRAARTPATPS
ncbi:MAG: hypothetical protein KF886_06965 [Candidatus Hydrogenedentes bacterium]|nr:hypothetical protein [Candidatus Hydrogenedentota bacterium]